MEKIIELKPEDKSKIDESIEKAKNLDDLIINLIKIFITKILRKIFKLDK